MSTRTITGNLAEDPVVQQAGNVSITKLRVIENTGEYRDGKWVAHDVPTTHFVEAKFELGENIAASLHKGDGVVVVGRESSWTSGEGDTRKYGRTINAEFVGADLNRAVVRVSKVIKDDAGK
jgi:single-strand DNA-binding protein